MRACAGNCHHAASGAARHLGGRLLAGCAQQSSPGLQGAPSDIYLRIAEWSHRHYVLEYLATWIIHDRVGPMAFLSDCRAIFTFLHSMACIRPTHLAAQG